MSAVQMVRRFALLDVVVTGLLALPWLADHVLALMVTWFGLDGSPSSHEFPALMMVFVNLAGVLGVVWNGRRYVKPTADLVRWDMRARVAVAALFVYYVLARDAPSILLLFVVTELGGALAARRFLAGPQSAIS